MFATRKALVVGFAIGALALAGCTPGADGGTGKDSAKPADVLSMLAQDAKGSLTTVAEKTAAAKSATVKMTGTVAGIQTTATGQISYGDPVKAALTMEAMGQQVQTRLIGTTQYMQMPMLGGKWIKIDLTAVAGAGGMDPQQFKDQMNGMDPSKQVKAMLEKGTLKVAGKETLDGVQTVRYVSDLTLDEYLDAYVSPEKKSQMRETLKGSGMSSVKSELWVDEQYQVRKFHLASGTAIEMTCVYTDYGKPVDVIEPPASEVTDMSALLLGLGTQPA